MSIIAFLILAFTGSIIYFNSLHCSFHFDDFYYITNNPAIRQINDLAPFWQNVSERGRIVGYYSFALNYHFHQLNVVGYHIVNIVIHILNAGLAYILTRLMLTYHRREEGQIHFDDETQRWIALTASIIFLVHPLQTQSVTYICQRFSSLAAMFYLASTIAFIRTQREMQTVRRFAWWGLCLLSMALAMFTKENSFTLPMMLVLVGVFILRENKVFRFKYWVWLIPFVVIIPLLFSFRFDQIFGLSLKSGSHIGDVMTPWHYFLTQMRVIMTYLKLYFIPIHQNLDYDYAISTTIFDPRVLGGATVLMGMFWAACRYRHKNPLFSFGIFWFFLTLAVESSIIPIRHVIFEHRMYLPLAGLAIASASIIASFYKNISRTIILSLIVIILGTLTIERNEVWKDELSLWSNVVAESPNKSRGYNYLGRYYMEKENYKMAMDYFTKAIELDPTDKSAWNNRGGLNLTLKKYDLALADIRQALNLDPEYAEAYNNRGVLFNGQGYTQYALDDFNKAISIEPLYADALLNRGNLHKNLGDVQASFEDYSKIISSKPNYVKAYVERGFLYLNQQRFDLAAGDFDKFLSFIPNDATALYGLSLCYAGQGRLNEAYELAKRAQKSGHTKLENYLKKLSTALEHPGQMSPHETSP